MGMNIEYGILFTVLNSTVYLPRSPFSLFPSIFGVEYSQKDQIKSNIKTNLTILIKKIVTQLRKLGDRSDGTIPWKPKGTIVLLSFDLCLEDGFCSIRYRLKDLIIDNIG